MEIRSRDSGHAHLWVVLWSLRREASSSMSVPNLKWIAIFVHKLLGDPKISKLSPDQGDAHLGVVLYSLRTRGPSSISIPNLKRIAQYAQKLLGGPTILKLGHATLSHAPFEPETLNLCRHPSSYTCCQILCFYFDSLLSNGWKQCQCAISMEKLAMHMCRVMWPGGRGLSKTTYLESATPICPIYNFYGATMTIKVSLHGASPILKWFSAEKFLRPVKSGPKNGGFSGIRGLNVKFLFCNPEMHILARNHVVWRILRESRFRGLGCRPLKEPGKKKTSNHFWCAISHIQGKETLWAITTKFCPLVDIRDLITCATFGDDRLRGLGVARGRISYFPIDLRRRPYNSVARVCD